MTDSVQRKSRIPHWGWLLAGTILIVVVFVGVRFGIPIYQRHELLVDFEKRGFTCFFKNNSSRSRGPSWLRSLVGDRWTDALYEIDFVSVYSYSDGPAFSDADMHHLTGLKSLHGAELLLCRITDSGMTALKGLDQLEYLNIGATDTTDDSLVLIAGLKGLQNLQLTGTAITDAGLSHLTQLIQLKQLNLERTRVTPVGIAKLQAVLPHCKIEGP